MSDRRYSLILGVAGAAFVLDRVSKLWIVEWMNLREILFIPVVDPFLNLTMAWNRGVNFGLFATGDTGRWVLIGIALAIVVGLLVWARGGMTRVQAAATGLIVGGAIGNVWDRVQYGAVADFLNMSCCGIDNPFAFNVADAAIFGGALTLAFFSGSGDKDEAPRDGA
jgi:signal peptidase II